MQAISFAVQYSFATFWPEVTSLSLRADSAEERSLLYIPSVEKLMAQSKQYDLHQHIVANSQGFLLNVTVGSFSSVLDTYQQMAKNLVREVLHSTFFMPRGDAVIMIPQAIAGRIDNLHQMLGLKNGEALCCEEHAV